MNKNGKIKGKYNVIDIFVVLLFVAVVIGIALRFFVGSIGAGSKIEADAEFEYTVKIESVRKYTIDALNKKGAITDYDAEEAIGEIVKVEAEPARYLSEKANGEMVYASQPDRYMAYVTIRRKGVEAKDRYLFVDKSEISIGRNIEIITKYVHTSGDIVDVKKVKSGKVVSEEELESKDIAGQKKAK